MINKNRLEQKKKFLKVLKDGGERQRNNNANLLKSTNKRTALIGRQLTQAYKPRTTVVWRSFLVPTELFYATSALPFTPEMSCSAIAQSQPVIRKVVQRAEEKQYEPKLCSFLKSTIGGVYEGIMPTPDLVIGSPCFCSGIGSVLHDVSRYYGSDYFYLNIPLDHSTESVEYVASQLKKLTVLLCRKSGIDIEEVERERLPKAIELSNQAALYWKKIEVLRQTIPSPMPSGEALDYATVLAQTWGSEEIVEIYSLLYSELKERVKRKTTDVPDEKLRLLWLHLRPYYPNKIFDIMKEHGAVIVFEEVNYPARNEMDPSNPYKSLAHEVLSNSGRYRVSENRAKDLVHLAEKFEVDGVIHFSHDNCEWTKNTFPIVSKFLQRKGSVPLLNLSSDCLLDECNELIRTRLSAFLESLKTRKAISNNNRSKFTAPPKSADKKYFMGIDVGSATTKVVVLNQKEKGKILGWSIYPTAADNKNAIERASKIALEMAGNINVEHCKNIVATGVGCNNVSFASQRVTEITCHTAGIKHFFPEVKTIVDIGGQDTKVILADEVRFRMNDACAAGTGKFLVAMANALGITLEDLDTYDSQAKKSLALSRMCTIFAESEVVSSVATGASVNEIVRGIHKMVSSKTITLLRQLSPKVIAPVAMSGGVALNGGVVRALERGFEERLLIPDNPQLIGALGAAIIASQNNITN
jgi:predicted CoA-substrate-specific enzyme activase